GAPASPLRYAAPARATRLSPSRREQAGDGLSWLHVPRRAEGARRMAPRLRRLNLRPLRARGAAAAQPAADPRSGTAQHRRRGAALGGEGHRRGDPRLVDVDAVDEAQVVDVERDLGVEALADGAHDLRLAEGAAAIVDGGAGRRRRRLGHRRFLYARPGPGV